MQKVAGHCGKCGAPYFLDEKWDGEGVPAMNPTCMCWNMNSPYIDWMPLFPEPPFKITCTPPPFRTYPEPDPDSTIAPPWYREQQTGDPSGGWFPNTCSVM